MARRLNWERSNREKRVQKSGSIPWWKGWESSKVSGNRRRGKRGQSVHQESSLSQAKAASPPKTQVKTRSGRSIRLGHPALDLLQEEFRRVPRNERAMRSSEFKERLRTIRHTRWASIWADRFEPMMRDDRATRLRSAAKPSIKRRVKSRRNSKGKSATS